MQTPWVSGSKQLTSYLVVSALDAVRDSLVARGGEIFGGPAAPRLNYESKPFLGGYSRSRTAFLIVLSPTT
jgi:hypothetical protein